VNRKVAQLFICKRSVPRFILNKFSSKNKFETRSVESIFVGYSEVSKPYCVLFPKEKIHIFRDIKFFDEFDTEELQDIISETKNSRFKILKNSDADNQLNKL